MESTLKYGVVAAIIYLFILNIIIVQGYKPVDLQIVLPLWTMAGKPIVTAMGLHSIVFLRVVIIGTQLIAAIGQGMIIGIVVSTINRTFKKMRLHRHFGTKR